MQYQQSRGFTLLELLVVVFMVGVILTFSQLAVGPSQGRLLDQEAKRILGLMEVAKDEAILNAQEMAFTVNDKGYGFQLFSVEGWQAIEGDNVLRNRTLPENMRLDMNILGEDIKLAVSESVVSLESDEDKEKKDNVLARVMFLSSGEITPFELFIHFDTEEDGLTIEGTELGELTLKTQKVTL